MVIIYITIVSSFLIIYDLKKEFLKDTRVNLDTFILNIIAIIILLGITNPFLEEWFWRIFL